MTRRFRVLFVIALVICGLQPSHVRAQSSEQPAEAEPAKTLPGVKIASTVAAATGVAITPLLGVSAFGVWTYYRSRGVEGDDLPWFASHWFWGPGLVIGLLLVFKDPVLGLVPGAKKPLDAVDVLENKVSALLAAPALLPSFLAALFPNLQERLTADGAAVAHAGLPNFEGWTDRIPDLGTIGLASVVFLAGFFTIWLAFHAINVLILLSPFGFLDTLLRSIKLVFLVVLGLSTLVHPYIGVAFAVLILLASIPIACWSWRFMVFGSVHAADIAFRRHRELDPESKPLRAFTATEVEGVPPRTYGEVELDGADIVFSHRPWGVLPKRRAILSLDERSPNLGCGLMGPVVRSPLAGDRRRRILLRFPPRYRGHEQQLAALLGMAGVVDLPIRRGIRATIDWCRETAGKGWSLAGDLVSGES